MKIFTKWLSWQKLVFLILLLVVVWQNRVNSGDYLSGWDNLHPELDFGLEISRGLSAVWQEFRGLGNLGGMGHAADLPRTVILWIFSAVVPASYLRWGWHVLMLVTGPIGVWYLTQRLWKWSESASLVAGSFYLLNMATVQYFYVPYESFGGFYGFLPWLIALFTSYLDGGEKRDLMKFFGISFLATTAFYVQTLFVVYVLILILISLRYLRQSFRRVLAVWLVLVAVNAFWLLPLIKFMMTSVSLVGVSKINSIASPETMYMNESMGGWKDVLGLRGFWLEYVEWRGEDWGRLLSGWFDWSNYKNMNAVNVAIGVLGAIGVVLGVIKKKLSMWVMLGLGFSYAMLASRNLPFGVIYTKLIESMPLVGEMFRSVFTKWSVVMALFLSIGVGMIVELMRSRKIIAGMITGLLLVSFGYVVKPVFTGNLILHSMKIEFPDEYEELYDYFDKEDKTARIAYLPSAWAWGWQYHDWGYRGSGFLWYGIEQPILDRAFDVWSPYNESFYNELSTALYGCGSIGEIDPGCVGDVSRVLEKYDVGYVLLDESVIAPGQGEEILRVAETKEIAEELEWEKVFDEGFLTVWETTYGQQDKFVDAPESYVVAEGETVKTRRDVIYEEMGMYVEGESGTSYPFARLMREKVNVEYKEDMVEIVRKIDGGGELVVPGFEKGEMVEMMYRLQMADSKLEIEWEPAYRVSGEDGPKLVSQEYEIDDKYLWVQIGENEAVFLEEGRKVSGSAKLSVGEEIEITTYDGIVEREENVELVGAQKCGEDDKYQCYAIPLDKPDEDSLLQVVTVYEGGVSPEVCLDLEGQPYECVNVRKMGESGMVSMLSVELGERYWLDYVLRDDVTVLQDPIVRWYPINLQFTIYNLQNWGEFLREQRYSLQGPTLKVEVGREAKIYDLASMGRVEALNCDVLERGVVSKESGKYMADEYGANCDHVVMGGMDVEMSYLMRMQGENIEGRSVKLFLHNTGSERNDLEYLLQPKGPGPAGGFDQTFSLLPWKYSGSYSLNVETRSFGQYSENMLEPVEVRWVPLEQIAGARIQPARSDLVGLPTRSDLEVREVKKAGTWLYQVEVEGEGLISLSQGYDDGWVGIAMPNLQFTIYNLQNIEKLEHVKVNGWKNGWVVNDQSAQGGSAFGGREERGIAIFYWPQLLEYLGFLMLGVTGVWVWKSDVI